MYSLKRTFEKEPSLRVLICLSILLTVLVSSLQICVMECEGKLFSSATWGLCNKAISGRSSLSLDHNDTSDGSQTPLGDLHDQLKIPKRVGDFLRGPFNYGQMEEPEVQELQKRFGGFIGVRKSARKWHNQKRFSEFLKQYLGMSPRSVEYDGLADDLKEQNEI
uniref:Prepronociceptin n=1 Tax=Naja naja TaxID=35670 RepID=A0A8C6VDA3_NAJNA